MRDQNQPLNYYEILGVSQGAPMDEIRRAYRREAMEWHPDRNKDPNAPRMMGLINEAWEVLGNPERRAEYDREIVERTRYYESVGTDRDTLDGFRVYLLPWLLEREIDLYEVLGVPNNATVEDVRRAYADHLETIEYSREFGFDATGTVFMRLLRIAGAVLSHPEARAEYDQHYFLMRSKIAKEERARQEAARREFERQEQERLREQAQREAEIRRQKEEAERREREQKEVEKRREQERREAEKRREREQREAEARQRKETKRVAEEHRKRERARIKRERRKVEDQTNGRGGGGSGPPIGTTSGQHRNDNSKWFVALILFVALAVGASLLVSFWPDQANAPTPTATPKPLPVPTAQPLMPPTITIEVARNRREGIDRVATIHFSDLSLGNPPYSFVASASDSRCEGPGMGALISIGAVDNANVTRTAKIPASCRPGIHHLKVKLYREATLVAERQILFSVVAFTPTPSPTTTSTSIPTPTYTATPLPTPTLTSTSTATPTPSPSPTATPTPTSTATPTPSPSPTATPTPTSTATPTFSPSPTGTPTSTATATPTPTATSTPVKYVAISSGSWHVCALREGGSVECWLNDRDAVNDLGQSVPPKDGSFVSISSGRYHSCALKATGTTECWGSNDHGQLLAPQQESFVGISTGLSALHTCGLRHDGSIACWGAIGGPYDHGQASPPQETGFSVVSSGFSHTCAIHETGEPVCWGVRDGKFDFGQASPPHDHDHALVAINSGWSHTCALREDGSPICWGAVNTPHDYGQASPPTGEKLTAISSGVNHSCGLRIDGTPVCWGATDTEIDRGQALPPGGETFTSISSGREFTCGLRLDGNVICWGALALDAAQLDQTSTDAADGSAVITPTPLPTHTPTPILLDTPTTTSTTIPTPTNTPMPTSAPTATPTNTPIPTPTPTLTPTPTATRTTDTTLDVADVVEQARSGVVYIEGTSGTGSGFVVDSDGYIMTNEHVISGQSRLTVVFDNGARLTATVFASDATRDIALLKVTSGGNLTVLPFAPSVREGDEVVALGHPLNLGGSMTITKGIVSAFRIRRGVSLIQTDAAINLGNSGGPLLNLKGEVVGMNTSILRDIRGEDHFAQGIGFAIKFDVLVERLEVMKSGQSFAPTPTPRAVATQTPSLLFGPKSGSIEHDLDDDLIDVYQTDTWLSDGIVEARFFNPYSDQDGLWSSGFLFRHNKVNVFHIVAVRSSGSWYHHLRKDDGESEPFLAGNYSTHISTTSSGSNHIRIIMRGSEGWLFINGAFVDKLDLGGLTEAGSVSAVGSYFRDDGIKGNSTRFEDFTIRSLHKVYGPLDGKIEHKEAGVIDKHEIYTSLTDGIFEASFYNPYASSQGDWSSGFHIRDSRVNVFHAIVIEEDGYWHHFLRTGDANTGQHLDLQYSNLISTTSNASNHIRIIALGDEGWIFINGTYMDKLDLSGLTTPGSVSAITNHFLGDGITGYSTRFEDFTIWSADGQ